MPSPANILIVDDEEAICFAFKRYFESRGCCVRTASSAAQGLADYRTWRPDVTFLDVRLGDGNGLDVLEDLRRHDPAACVVIMTAYGSLQTVTRAVNGKAFDYLVKPVDLARAGELVEQALAGRTGAGGGAASAQSPAGGIVCSSAGMQEVFKRVVQVAQVDTSVLLRGQTGTGKEVVARAIHDHGRRKSKPFVAVNCGALPENLVESELFGYVRGAFSGAEGDKPGRFELADQGTLFLDEIGELPLAAQVKLLRFLDSQTVERLGSVRPRQVDVRVVAATNRDLMQAIEEGRFRRDLYYRLAVMEIAIPPLAQRVEDVLPLAEHFLAVLARDDGLRTRSISPEAAAALKAYPWPGNVRELRNAVEHAAVVSAGATILPAHLPEAVRLGRPALGGDDPESLLQRYAQSVSADDRGLFRRGVEPLERLLILRVLRETNGNQTAAAERLGLHRNTLRIKIREYGLE